VTAVTEAATVFVRELFHSLWERYRARVSYVRDYERMVRENGATFVNDHIAFRTLGTTVGTNQIGMVSLAVLFRPLGFRPVGAYEFKEKRLRAVHLQHPDPTFPKLFVSELEVEKLGPEAQAIIARYMLRHRDSVREEELQQIRALATLAPRERNVLLTKVQSFFETLPWGIPDRSDVEELGRHSQYGAWVLMHGYEVNHFTASVNSHGVPAIGDIERTVGEMRARGVPMKTEIEGERGSKLRQSATESVVIPVTVRGPDGRMQEMSWTYAYFEIAERGTWTNPETGESELFQGFLGPQANQLFEMTAMKALV
jgi:2-oxoadipate dioxygenase/decarboxylase-like protein